MLECSHRFVQLVEQGRAEVILSLYCFLIGLIHHQHKFCYVSEAIRQQNLGKDENETRTVVGRSHCLFLHPPFLFTFRLLSFSAILNVT